MENNRIADIFDEIADMLEFKQENPFKIRAYRKAGQTLRSMSEDIEEYARNKRLMSLPGIGKELSDKIEEIIDTGKLKAYERLKKDMPQGIFEIMSIPGVGPKTAKLLYDKLKIDSVEKLKKAAEKGKLSELPHIKEKTQENILKGISFMQAASEKMMLGKALFLAEEIVDKLKAVKEADDIAYAGSLRRMKETVRDIDILATSQKPARVMEAFVKLAQIKKVLAHGETKSSAIIDEGIQVDLRVVEPSSYGAAMVYFTGSKAHNIHIRKIAVAKKLKINEYGVFNIKTNKKIAGRRESDVYKAVGLEWVPPEIREDTGEIEASMAHRLPHLVELKDIKGDLHVHSSFSDGSHSLEELADICSRIGYEYIAVTDHSKSLRIANGLSEKELLKQVEKIRRLNSSLKGFRMLTGTETEIGADGSLDFSDSALKELDIIVGALHSGFKQTKEQITKRILKAMDNPYMNILAHPTGRLLGARQAYEVDLERVLSYAKDRGVAVEINGFPERLDLDDIHTKRAVETGVKLVVSTDAHHRGHFGFMKLGVSVARRGWAEKKDILNTLCLSEFIKKIKRP